MVPVSEDARCIHLFSKLINSLMNIPTECQYNFYNYILSLMWCLVCICVGEHVTPHVPQPCQVRGQLAGFASLFPLSVLVKELGSPGFPASEFIY